MRQQEAAQKSLAAISSILLLHMQTKSENCLDFKRKWGGEELINERERERFKIWRICCWGEPGSESHPVLAVISSFSFPVCAVVMVRAARAGGLCKL